MSVVAGAVLGLGLAALAVSLLGMLRAPTPADSLHHLSAGSVWGPLLVGLALVLDAGPLSESGVKTALAVLLVLLQSPLSSHELVRLAFLRERQGGGEEP